MWRMLGGALAVLLMATVVWAQEEEKKEPASSPADQLKQLEKEFQDAMTKFSTEYRKAETDEERQKLVQDVYPRPDKFAGKFLELAEKNPDDPAAIDALVWVATNAGFGPDGSQAINTLAEKYVESDKLGPVCMRLMYGGSPDSLKLLRAVIEKNPHHTVQGMASYALAKSQMNRGEEGVKEAEELFEKVVKDFGDVNAGRDTIGKIAERDLFELRFLSIGKVAPEIKGEDIDGVEFKLSDYRGKVVVIDFWGNW
jgi:hypothetical protein